MVNYKYYKFQVINVRDPTLSFFELSELAFYDVSNIVQVFTSGANNLDLSNGQIGTGNFKAISTNSGLLSAANQTGFEPRRFTDNVQNTAGRDISNGFIKITFTNTPYPNLLGHTITTSSRGGSKDHDPIRWKIFGSNDDINYTVVFNQDVSANLTNAGRGQNFPATGGYLLSASLVLPPTLSRVDVSNTFERVSWTSVTDASFYTIERSTDISFNTISQTLNTRDLSFNFTGLTPGTWYYYRGRTTTINNESSDFSSTLAIKTLSNPPIDLSATDISNTSLKLTWSSAFGATSYVIQRDTDPSFSPVDISLVGITDLSRNITGLTPGTRYYFRIASTNESGTDSFAPYITVKTLSNPPTDISFTNITTTSHRITWTASTGATSYLVYCDSDSSFNPIDISFTTTNTFLDISGLNSASRYYYKIASINESGTDGFSAPVNVLNLPSAPTIVNTIPFSSSCIDISWTPVSGIINNLYNSMGYIQWIYNRTIIIYIYEYYIAYKNL
jgi:hypothetical protein